MRVFDSRDFLLAIDVQRDFCQGGALAVPDGEAVVAPINRLISCFESLGLTQDWHPLGHKSFASAHPGCQVFDAITLSYGPQTLWPDHCVQGTEGAEFHPSLSVVPAQILVRKGFHPEIDSYSAFFENDRQTPTGLGGYLAERGIRHVWMAGLATEFCVAFSALDARRLGFEVTLLLAACRGLGDTRPMLETLREAGVHLTETLPV